jgi:hypothetical protein
MNSLATYLGLLVVAGLACARTELDRPNSPGVAGQAGTSQMPIGGSAGSSGGGSSGSTFASGGTVALDGGSVAGLDAGGTGLGGSISFSGGASGAGSSLRAPGGGTLAAGGATARGGTVSSGGATPQGGNSESGGQSAGSTETGGAPAFPLAQPGRGLTDILPQFTPTADCLACAQQKCPSAIVCSNDPACALEMSCVVNDCWAQNRGAPDELQEASTCITNLSSCSLPGVDIQACLGTTCLASSIPATLAGLDSIISCLEPYCIKRCQQ